VSFYLSCFCWAFATPSQSFHGSLRPFFGSILQLLQRLARLPYRPKPNRKLATTPSSVASLLPSLESSFSRAIADTLISPDVPEQMEGFPMRAWSIELWLLDEQGQQIPATIFEKVMYELHPTFAKPKQSMLFSFIHERVLFRKLSRTTNTRPL
jgi:hypothetical protein